VAGQVAVRPPLGAVGRGLLFRSRAVFHTFFSQRRHCPGIDHASALFDLGAETGGCVLPWSQGLQSLKAFFPPVRHFLITALFASFLCASADLLRLTPHCCGKGFPLETFPFHPPPFPIPFPCGWCTFPRDPPLVLVKQRRFFFRFTCAFGLEAVFFSPQSDPKLDFAFFQGDSKMLCVSRSGPRSCGIDILWVSLSGSEMPLDRTCSPLLKSVLALIDVIVFCLRRRTI